MQQGAPRPPSGARDVVIERHAAPDARAGAGGQRSVRVSHRRLSLTEHRLDPSGQRFGPGELHLRSNF